MNAPVFRPDWRALAALGLVLVFAAWRFIDTIEDMHSEAGLIAADHATYLAFQHARHPWLDQVMITITELGDQLVVIAVAVAVAAWLAWQRTWRTLIFWLVAVAGGSIINTAIKVEMHRARPGDMHYAGWSSFSFPSGHSTTNTVLYGFLAIIIMRLVKPAWRLAVAAGVVVLVAAIAVSRLYVGAHWLSDVIGGLTFGSLWLALLGLVYLYRQAEPVDPWKLLGVAAAALVLAAGVNITLHHAVDLQRYAVNTCLVDPTGTCTQ